MISDNLIVTKVQTDLTFINKFIVGRRMPSSTESTLTFLQLGCYTKSKSTLLQLGSYVAGANKNMCCKFLLGLGLGYKKKLIKFLKIL